MRGKRNFSAGFTLLELMIGLIVIGIVLGFIAISSLRTAETTRVRSAAMDIVGLFNYARSKAIHKRKLFRVQMCTYTSQCIFADHPNKFAQLPGSGKLHNGIILVEECETSRMVRQLCGSTKSKQELQAYNLIGNYRDVRLEGIYISSNSSGGNFLKYSDAALLFKPDGSVRFCRNLASLTRGQRLSNCSYRQVKICLKAAKNTLARIITLKINGTSYVEVDLNNFCK